MLMAMTTETLMSASDRAATCAYLKDLEREFRENSITLFAARDTDDRNVYLGCSNRSQSLYREISEVKVALERGVLPF